MVASSLDDTHPIKCWFTGASTPGSQAELGNQDLGNEWISQYVGCANSFIVCSAFIDCVVSRKTLPTLEIDLHLLLSVYAITIDRH